MDEKKIIVTSINAICEKGVFFTKEDIITKKVEDIWDIDDFIKTLEYFGYEREYEVSGQGVYSVKGGIVDVFVMGEEKPVRIEFFDDEIDSIRTFDTITGKSIDMLESFTLVPAKTSILNFEKLNELNKKARGKLEKDIAKNTDEEIDKNCRELYEKIKDNTNSTTKYVFYALKELKSVLDLFTDPIIIFDDYSLLKKSYNSFYKKNKEELKDLYEREYKGKPSRPRILITGCPTTGVMDKIIKRIEELGADVVGFENCCGPREKKDPIDETKDPITAIAEKYLRVNCSVMSPNPGRLEALDVQIDEYQVDGVVEVLLQACHTFAIESDAVKTFVTKEKHIPYIAINTDYSPADQAQIDTRLGAFIELLQ